MAGDLETLEFVEGFVEAPLYWGLVAGERGEGVGVVRVLHKSRTQVIERTVELGEYIGLHSAEAAQPPMGGDDPVHEQVFQFSYGFQLFSQSLAQLL